MKTKKAKTEGAGQRKKNGWLLAIQAAGVLMIIASLAGLGAILAGYWQSDAEYAELEQYVSFSYREGKTESTGETMPETDIWKDQDIGVDFVQLKERNLDVIAWIAFDNLDISYPVMYSGDNEYYLRRTFNRTANTAGSIFLEAANQPDFSDYHMIFYGHNMKNGSMFGKLKKYQEEAFYKENQYFTVYTPQCWYRFRIFSVQTVAVDDEVYTVGFGPDETFAAFAGSLKEKSLYDTGVEVCGDRKILTLSTCTYADDLRFVVHGVCIETKELTE